MFIPKRPNSPAPSTNLVIALDQGLRTGASLDLIALPVFDHLGWFLLDLDAIKLYFGMEPSESE